VKSLDEMTEPELRRTMNQAADLVKMALPAGTGFLILAAPFGPGGIAQYIGNGQRADFVRWMRETADRLESREDVPR
jgi:hypothetical protein